MIFILNVKGHFEYLLSEALRKKIDKEFKKYFLLNLTFTQFFFTALVSDFSLKFFSLTNSLKTTNNFKYANSKYFATLLIYIFKYKKYKKFFLSFFWSV